MGNLPVGENQYLSTVFVHFFITDIINMILNTYYDLDMAKKCKFHTKIARIKSTQILVKIIGTPRPTLDCRVYRPDRTL